MNTILSSVIIWGLYAWEKNSFSFLVIRDRRGVVVPVGFIYSLFVVSDIIYPKINIPNHCKTVIGKYDRLYSAQALAKLEWYQKNANGAFTCSWDSPMARVVSPTFSRNFSDFSESTKVARMQYFKIIIHLSTWLYGITPKCHGSSLVHTRSFHQFSLKSVQYIFHYPTDRETMNLHFKQVKNQICPSGGGRNQT